jgi:RNA polymerase sigma factor (TIGR02999 family)
MWFKIANHAWGMLFWIKRTPFRNCCISALYLDYRLEMREAAPPKDIGRWVGRVGSDISSLIEVVDQGDGPAAEALFSALYSELRRVARRELARHGGPVTLSATTLLHEAYLDIASQHGSPSFPDRARFMSYAARVMRGLIIDYARNRHAQKRGGQFEITALSTEVGENLADPHQLAEIGAALDELAKADASLAEVVDLKFFCGFSFAEIAALRGISERTVQRKWEKARIYLHHSIRAQFS